jgi:hypothetical protein
LEREGSWGWEIGCVSFMIYMMIMMVGRFDFSIWFYDGTSYISAKGNQQGFRDIYEFTLMGSGFNDIVNVLSTCYVRSIALVLLVSFPSVPVSVPRSIAQKLVLGFGALGFNYYSKLGKTGMRNFYHVKYRKYKA